jgi:hypothetical protein|tara:strand:- start:283 stop:516 length:234 start_codon:yes stop_codon:yes gene_type:complete
MTKTDIANQICTHLNIVAPSLSAAKKDELLLLAEAVGLVLGQNRTPAQGTSRPSNSTSTARPSEAVVPAEDWDKPPW